MKQRKNSLIPGLAPEGVPFVLFGAALFLAILIIPAWLGLLVFLAYTAFAVWFFRDPERSTPPGDNLVISPADGTVVEVEDTDAAPYTGEPSKKIGIFMSGFDVHVNRNPVSGTVEAVHYRQGGFVKADLPQASMLNEHNAVILKREDGARVVFIQISGLVARRIVCYLSQTDRAVCGERMGMIRFGSRVDVYVPPAAKVSVKKGDKLKAGESVLGSL